LSIVKALGRDEGFRILRAHIQNKINFKMEALAGRTTFLAYVGVVNPIQINKYSSQNGGKAAKVLDKNHFRA
jgi:hypothetical protein